MSVGKRILYLDDVLLEHMHFSLGKSELDQTYKNLINKKRSPDPDGMFFNLGGFRQNEAVKLQKATELITHNNQTKNCSIPNVNINSKSHTISCPSPRISFNYKDLSNVKTKMINGTPRVFFKETSVDIYTILSSLEKSHIKHPDYTEEQISTALSYAAALADSIPWGIFSFNNLEDLTIESQGCPIHRPLNIADTWMKEQQLDEIFKTLSENIEDSDKIVLFGAGKHSETVLDAAIRFNLISKIPAILEDSSDKDNISNIPVLRPEEFTENYKYIVISSDCHERILAERAQQFVNESTEIICPYSFAFS